MPFDPNAPFEVLKPMPESASGFDPNEPFEIVGSGPDLREPNRSTARLATSAPIQQPQLPPMEMERGYFGGPVLADGYGGDYYGYKPIEKEIVAEVMRPQPTELDRKREQLEREREETFKEMRGDTLGKVATRAGLSIGQGGGTLRKIEGGVLQALPLDFTPFLDMVMKPLTGETQQEAGRRIRAEGRKIEQKYRDLGADMQGGALSDIVQEFGATSIVSAPTIPAAIFGGVPAAATLAGMQSLGGTFDEATEKYKQRGDSQEVAERKARVPAYLSAGITAGVTAAFGPRGVEALANRNFNPKGVSDIVFEVFKQTGFEATEEVIDEIGQNIVAKLSYDPNRTIGEAVETSIFAGLAGGLMGFGATGVFRGAEAGGRRLEQDLQRGQARRRRLISLQDYRGSPYRAEELAGIRREQAERREVGDITESVMQQRFAPQRTASGDIERGINEFLAENDLPVNTFDNDQRVEIHNALRAAIDPVGPVSPGMVKFMIGQDPFLPFLKAKGFLPTAWQPAQRGFGSSLRAPTEEERQRKLWERMDIGRAREFLAQEQAKEEERKKARPAEWLRNEISRRITDGRPISADLLSSQPDLLAGMQSRGYVQTPDKQWWILPARGVSVEPPDDELTEADIQAYARRRTAGLPPPIIQRGAPDANQVQIPVAQVPGEPQAAPSVQAVPGGSPGGLPQAAGTAPPQEAPQAPVEAPDATGLDVNLFAVIEVPTARIKLSKDVPNFKADADPDTGVVPGQELKASAYERVGTAPIVLWQRLNGDLEVITGRHKFDLARRLGEKTVPAQIVREDQGWTRARAAMLDAEANIRDGQGTAGDYANYFRNSEITRAQAEARGLLSRAKGRAGYNIGKLAIPELYDLFTNDRINEESASIIAETAPLDVEKQRVGIRRALAGDRPGAIKARMEIEKARTDSPVQTDLFGNAIWDERDAQRQADEVDMIRRELRAQVSAVRGAANNPEAARKLGVDIRDPEGVKKRIAQIESEIAAWDGNWWLNRELVNKLAERTATERTKREQKEKQKEKEKQPKVLGELEVSVQQDDGRLRATFYADEDQEVKVGYGQLDGRVINYVEVEEAFRDQGIGQKIVAYLRERGGQIAVTTTPEAAGMMRAAGAKEYAPNRFAFPEAPEYQTPPAEPAPAPAPAAEPEAIPPGYTKADLDELRALRAELRSKLGGTQTSFLGADPDILRVLARMAGIHIKAGAIRTFRAFAEIVKKQMPDLWDKLKFRLHGAYMQHAVRGSGLERINFEDADKIIDEIDGVAPRPAGAGDVAKLMELVDRRQSEKSGEGEKVSFARKTKGEYPVLKKFAEFLAARGISNWDDLAQPLVVDFMREMMVPKEQKGRKAKEGKLSRSTVNAYRGAVRRFLKYLENEVGLAKLSARLPRLSTIESIRELPAKKSEEAKEPISLDVLEKMLDPGANPSATDLRLLAAMEIAYATGLRPIELLRIRLDQLDLANRTIKQVKLSAKLKTIDSLDFRLPEVAVDMIQRYLREARPKLLAAKGKAEESEWLFPTEGGHWKVGSYSSSKTGSVAARGKKLGLLDVSGDTLSGYTFRKTLTQDAQDALGMSDAEINRLIPREIEGGSLKYYRDLDSPAQLNGVRDSARRLPHNIAFLKRKGLPLPPGVAPAVAPAAAAAAAPLAAPQAELPGQAEVFNLSGETEEDAARVAAEAAAEAQRKAEAAALEAKQQPRLDLSPSTATAPRGWEAAPGRGPGREWRAESLAELTALINSPDVNLPPEMRQAITALISSGLPNRLPALKWAIMDMTDGAHGSYSPNTKLIRFLNFAKSDTPVHEFFHHVWYYLQSADRDFIREMRRDSIRRELGRPQGFEEKAALGRLLNGTFSSDDFIDLDLPRSLYRFANEREFFVHMMTEKAMAEFTRPAHRNFIEYLREQLRKFWASIRETIGLNEREQSIWQRIISGKYDYDQTDAEAWNKTNRDDDGAPPPEPDYFQSQDEGAAKLQYASMEIPRLVRDIIEDRRAAERRLDERAFDTGQFRAAKQKIDELVTAAQREALNTGDPFWEIPDNIPTAKDPDLATKLQQLGIDFNPEALRAMQKDIAFEEDAIRQYRRRVRLADLERYVEILRGPMKLQPEDYTLLTQAIERVKRAIFRVANDPDNDNSMGITIDERSRQIRDSENTKPDDQAKADSLRLPFVRETFIDPMESGERMVERFGRTMQAFKAAMTDPALPAHYKRAIANMTEQLLAEFEDSAAKFDKYYQRERAGVAKRIRKLQANIADAKVRAGLGQILFEDALATGKGAKGLTGSWATREAVEYLINSYGAIIAFANNLRTAYPSGGAEALLMRLAGGLASADPAKFPQTTGYGGSVSAVLDAIKSGTDPVLNEVREKAGVSNEALSRILFVLARSPAFEDAVNTLLRYGEAKIASDPAVRLAQIARLIEEGSTMALAQAKDMMAKIANEARDSRDKADIEGRAYSKELGQEEIALKALDYGKELFEKVTGTPSKPNPEYLDVKRRSAEAINLERRMILSTGGTGNVKGQTDTVFEGFKVKNEETEIDQPTMTVSATDPLSDLGKNFDRIAKWFENGDRYIISFEEADQAWKADPDNNKSPEELGFDRQVYEGLVRVQERRGAFQDMAILHPGTTLAGNTIEQWKLNLRWFRQFLRGVKQARGQAARDLMSRMVNYGNTLLGIRTVTQAHRLKVLAAKTAALKSHPEFEGDLERWQLEVFNQVGSEGRKFGSSLRAGMALPVYGRVVTAEDISYLQALRRFYDDLRADITEKQGRGILIERGRGQEYKAFVRGAASVGDFGLPMHLSSTRGDRLVRDLMKAYPDENVPNKEDLLPTAASDLAQTGNSANAVVAFWNKHPEALTRHILDAGRAFRLMDQSSQMVTAERAAALELMDENNPRKIKSLDDAVSLIAEKFPENTGLDVRTYVADELLNELQQYSRNANTIQSEQQKLQKSQGVGGISLMSEFTQRASQFAFPSDWYDYGAVTDGDFLMTTARAMHEPIMEMSMALERTAASIQQELDDHVASDSMTSYKNDREARRVLKIIRDLLGDLSNTWNPKNPDNEKWALEFPPDLFKASLLANATVSMRNLVTGPSMAVIRMMALNRMSNGFAFLRSLAYLHKTLARVPLDLLVSQNYPVGRQIYKFLKGPGKQLLPALVANFAEKIVDGHINQVAEVNRLGFSIRQPYVESMRQMWRDLRTYQSTAQQKTVKESGAYGTTLRGVRNLFRMVTGLYQLVGPDYFDKVINAESLSWAAEIEKNLREVAEVYGSSRAALGKFDPTNADWLITPEEFSKRMSKFGKKKNLAEFRDFLQSADISLEQTLSDYYKRLQKARADGDQRPPPMFTDSQLAAVRRAVMREFNAADALNRPTAASNSRLFRMIHTFHGWPTDFLLKLTGVANGTRDQKTVERLITALPTMLALAGAFAVYSLYAQGMTDWYRRKFQGAVKRMVTIFDKEFWNDWKNAKEAATAALISAYPYYGDLALFAKGVVVNNRGYEPTGRILAFGIANDLFNALRGMWNMRNDGSSMLNPLRDFVIKYAAGAREAMVVANPDYAANREYRGANSAIAHMAQLEGFTTERTAGNVKPGIYYSATSGIREDITSGMMQQDPQSFDDAYNRLVKYYTDKNVDNPEQNARRDFMMLHPAVRGFGGKKPTQDEYDRVYGRMTPSQREAVDKATRAWDWASQRLGVTYNAFNQGGGGSIMPGGGGGIMGVSAGGSRAARTRRLSLRRRSSRTRRRGTRRLRLRRGRTRRLGLGRRSLGLRAPRRLGMRRLRLTAPRI